MIFSLFISCPRGLEYLLEDELKTIGFQVNRVSPQGVFGTASLSILYDICLWSRLANRVQLILFNGAAHNEKAIYALCHAFSWADVFEADKTLAVEFHGESEQIRNSMFGGQVVKDAIVDYFRNLNGTRPSVSKDNPEVLIHAHLKHDTLTVSLDLVGYSLHQRGYRTQAGTAPLKENIAAAMLIRAKWPQLSQQGYALHDPFCGAGTLVIEAAMMAANMAPGLIRDDQAFVHWQNHDPALWEKQQAHALNQSIPITNPLLGTDSDDALLRLAHANAQRAGVSQRIEFTHRPVGECKPIADKGLLICNPPYGERLGDPTQLIPLYQEFGQVLHRDYQRWLAAFLTSNVMLARATGLRAAKQYKLYNGALECKLYCVTLENNELRETNGIKFSAAAQMFANRLQKNHTHLRKWAQVNKIHAYRVYDADLPEYAFAIDLYNDYAVLQEYAPPASIPEHKAEQRRIDVQQVVPHILGLSADNVVMKQRKPQKGLNQYQKLDQSRRVIEIGEGNVTLIVNLFDYLDTGLFLDHRLLRLRFAQLKPGTRFLNCFCYTASASVHAAKAGAITTNVDLSNTYLQWAEDNFKANMLDVAKHQFIQYNCVEWLAVTKDKFDVIFLDPPSFSNSKRMDGNLDIQRDHESLIHSAMQCLAKEGTLYFSTNLRQFKLSPSVAEDFAVTNISLDTIDVDFKRNPRIHQCFVIKKKHA